VVEFAIWDLFETHESDISLTSVMKPFVIHGIDPRNMGDREILIRKARRQISGIDGKGKG
jgi:hypothetical protein